MSMFLCLGANSNPSYRSTGMKCLPASKIAQSNGVGIHDWHAEVLAIRAFNRFLVDECHNLLDGEDESSILQRKRHTSNTDGASLQLFEVKDDIKLHMYCSEAPCTFLSEYNCSSPDKSRWRRQHGAHDGCPKRCFCMGNPNSHEHCSRSEGGNIPAGTSLFLTNWNCSTETCPRRCTAYVIQILL